MKKIALTSLLAVFAVSGAHAANVIDGNPLYMPGQGHFYSVTGVESHTKNDTPWNLNEEFGYGITKNLAINVTTKLTENKVFDTASWDNLGLKVAFRALDMNEWKLDVIGAYGFDSLYNYPRPKPQDSWFDKDLSDYTWTAGVRGGYTSSRFTLAGKALFNYENTESFNWNEEEGKQGKHTLTLGIDGQLVLDSHWNLVASADYTGRLDKKDRGTPNTKNKNEGIWEGVVGVNYNIDSTKFVGAYINGKMNHHEGDKRDEWGWDEGFGFGAKFGIDF